ncbi:MAG: hypothetical protein KatS3mg015_1258 [Fimbriimonadales bacterium]|nr:MAG: hypothetical protein KatS3mg015_1258 [Fimbriimonadales bacterium]
MGGMKTGVWLSATVTAFVILSVLAREISVPPEHIGTASVVATVLFMFLPVCGIFLAATLPWTPRSAALVLAAGLSLVLLLPLAQSAVAPPLSSAIHALLQLARIAWPVCLGILVGTLIRDKNLLLPIAIFLATFDVLLVLAPSGATKTMMQKPITRNVFNALAYEVPRPRATTEAPKIRAQTLAQIGPADSLFLAMFAFCLIRFRMRFKETLGWMALVLSIYLMIVIFAGDRSLFGLPLKMLPGLLPMGAVVLLVNRKEFQLTAEEKRLTWGVAIVCALLILGAFLLRRPAVEARRLPPDPSPSPSVRSLDDASNSIRADGVRAIA